MEWMSLIDERLDRADPARQFNLDDGDVNDALSALASASSDAPRTRPHRRARPARRKLIAALATAAVLATGAVAAANWLDAHTGLFGGPGMTENDTTEW